MDRGPQVHSLSQIPETLRTTVVPTRAELRADTSVFDAQTHQLMARGVFVYGLSLALAHITAHLVYDVLVLGSFSERLDFRGPIVAINVALALLSRTPVRSAALPMTALLVLINVAWLQVYVVTDGRSHVDEASMVLVLVTASLLFPYTRNQMAALSVAAFAITTSAAWLGDSQGEGVLPVINVAFYTTVAGGIATIGAQLGYTRRRSEMVATEAAETERKKADKLLENILPEVIIERLKKSELVIADRFDSATVLFADLVGFTAMSSKASPEEVVALLNQIFTEFDRLSDRYRLEKIKTIGDAYMVAGGLPSPREGHARDIALMALDMRRVVHATVTPTGDPLEVRVGIHTGEVVAGVIGSRKFSYDLWGDVVNTASRMESHAPVGSIQLTDETRALLGDEFVLERQTGVTVKGKGEMNTWLLVRRVRD